MDIFLHFITGIASAIVYAILHKRDYICRLRKARKVILSYQVMQIANVLDNLADKDDTEWLNTAVTLRRLAECMRNNEQMISGIDIVDCMTREKTQEETLLLQVDVPADHQEQSRLDK